jgi:succinyl-diaminopimelate desuccinylase
VDVLDLLRELVRRPSVTPNDAGCQDVVAERLTAAGFEVVRLGFGDVENLWATHGSGAPLICLAGHTDVVPPGPRSSWHSEPFEPEIRDGYLYGRGASDMKASDAAMTVALEHVAQRGHRGTIALLLTSDEEGPGVDGTDRALRHLLDSGVKIDAAIVGEPTSEESFGDVVKNGRRGSMTGTLTVQGVQGHTAYPHLAQNAVHRLAPALADLVALDWGPGDENFPPTTLQVANISAGTGASNVVPGHCELQFNVRFGASHTPESISARVEEALRRHGLTEPVAWSVSALPFVTEAGPLIEALEGAIAETAGAPPRRSTGGGTSDARFFAAHGIPVAEFGPLNATIHAANESVEVACLEPLVQIYERALERFLAS